jgi:hypothetical protein
MMQRAVDIEKGYGPGSRGSISGRSKGFLFLHSSGAHPAFYTMDIGNVTPRVKLTSI